MNRTVYAFDRKSMKRIQSAVKRSEGTVRTGTPPQRRTKRNIRPVVSSGATSVGQLTPSISTSINAREVNQGIRVSGGLVEQVGGVVGIHAPKKRTDDTRDDFIYFPSSAGTYYVVGSWDGERGTAITFSVQTGEALGLLSNLYEWNVAQIEVEREDDPVIGPYLKITTLNVLHTGNILLWGSWL